MAVTTLLAVIVWVGRRFISSYLLPLLGILFLYILVQIVTQNPADVSGPVGIAQEANSASSWFDVLLIPASISLSLGLMNALPMYILDGGHIMDAILRPVSEKVASAFRISTTTIFLGFIAFVIIGDFVRL